MYTACNTVASSVKDYRHMLTGAESRLQLVQKIAGREGKEDAGDGHCDKVLAVAAHPHLRIIASAGVSGDCEIKVWEDKV